MGWMIPGIVLLVAGLFLMLAAWRSYGMNAMMVNEAHRISAEAHKEHQEVQRLKDRVEVILKQIEILLTKTASDVIEETVESEMTRRGIKEGDKE